MLASMLTERLRFDEDILTVAGRSAAPILVGREGRQDLCPVRALQE
jgi:hypothetical protein